MWFTNFVNQVFIFSSKKLILFMKWLETNSCLLNKRTQSHCLFCTTNHAHPAGRVDYDKCTNTGLAKQSHLSGWSCPVGPAASQHSETRPLESQRSPRSPNCETEEWIDSWTWATTELNYSWYYLELKVKCCLLKIKCAESVKTQYTTLYLQKSLEDGIKINITLSGLKKAFQTTVCCLWEQRGT